MNAPAFGTIQHGNADIELLLAGAAPLATADLFPERDDLLDPELVLLAHAYHAALLASARPVAPEAMP